jgi:hypothetical protein
MNWRVLLIQRIDYLRKLINYLRKKREFKLCCGNERIALNSELHNSNINRFNEITQNTNFAHVALSAAQEMLIYSKIDLSPKPWGEEFNDKLVLQFPSGDAPKNVLREFAYLFYKYKMNNFKCFYVVSNKILENAGGDAATLLVLIREGARDFRDVL